nr:EOG090X097L [Artemia franciscana]
MLHWKSNLINSFFFYKNFADPAMTIGELKNEIRQKKGHLQPERQELRLEPRSKGLDDKVTLEQIDIKNGSQLFLKVRTIQIIVQDVCFVEMIGPVLHHLIFLLRRGFNYANGLSALDKNVHKMNDFSSVAVACWSTHYLKRILETLFVHRFSHATMPLRHLYRNCAYYWIFALYVAYHINHPLYTAPSEKQVYASLAFWLFCETGNFSIHWLLRNLRPAGTKERRIPKPTGNPFTTLFNVVSCPNYTYEAGSWIAFSIMTQCLPALLFTLAGFYQMTVWALGKHRNYKKEFKDYPRNRKSIVPFVL